MMLNTSQRCSIGLKSDGRGGNDLSFVALDLSCWKALSEDAAFITLRSRTRVHLAFFTLWPPHRCKLFHFVDKCSPLAPAQRRTCQNIHTEWNELAEALSPEESKEGVSAAFNPGNDQEQCWCCNRSNVNRRVQTLIKMCAKIMQGVCMEVCVYVCVCACILHTWFLMLLNSKP